MRKESCVWLIGQVQVGSDGLEEMEPTAGEDESERH